MVWNGTVWADPIDAEAWRGRYLIDPNFRRETCVVAERDGELAGFLLGFIDRRLDPASAGSTRPCWIVCLGVTEELRRRGIGGELFRAFEREARERACTSIVVGPYVPSYIAPGVDVANYAESLGFFDAMNAVEIARPLSMKVSLTARRFPSGAFDVVPSHQGDITIREASPGDLLPCVEFVRRAFPEWIDDVSQVIQSISSSDHRHVSLHVAMRSDHCIGFALSRFERFGPFGVDPRERGKGVGRRLLDASLATMRAQGFHAAWFLWTSDRAASLYQRAGFEEVRRFSLRRKDLQ